MTKSRPKRPRTPYFWNLPTFFAISPRYEDGFTGDIEKIFATAKQARSYVSKFPNHYRIQRVKVQTYVGYKVKKIVTFIDAPDYPTFDERIANGKILIGTYYVRNRRFGEYGQARFLRSRPKK